MGIFAKTKIRYLTGEEIAAGDRIRIAGVDDGVILAVFAPGTEDGCAYDCPNGGFLYRCGRMGLVSQCDVDEDIEFVSRGDPPTEIGSLFPPH